MYLQGTDAPTDKAGGKQTTKKRAKADTGEAAKTSKASAGSEAAKLGAAKGPKSGKGKAGEAATAEPSADKDSDFVAPVGSGRAAAQNVKYADRSAFRGRADDWVEVAEAATAASEKEALEKLGASAGAAGLRYVGGRRATTVLLSMSKATYPYLMNEEVTLNPTHNCWLSCFQVHSKVAESRRLTNCLFIH
jgi:hypothetical protein